MEVKLYVGNLPYSTTEKDLRRLFAQAGKVASVDLIQDRQMGRSKGFAFVSMGTQAGAEKAIGMFNAHSLAGRELTVKLAETREAQGGYASRLSAFALADRRGNVPKPKGARSGYQSRLSAFGGGTSLSGPRRRGGGRRD
jgi:cold-inducible RNA-binding protein